MRPVARPVARWTRGLHRAGAMRACAPQSIPPEPAEEERLVGRGLAPLDAPMSIFAKPRMQKAAVFMGYAGSKFRGSQLNRTTAPGETVEECLMEALLRSGAVRQELFLNEGLLSWSRSSRTDKGAHAIMNVISAKLLFRCEDPWASDPLGVKLAASINQFLPPSVCVYSVQRVSGSFKARSFCCSRTYDYYVPSSVLRLDGTSRDDAILARLNEVLSCFVGRNRFHNYTKRKIYQTMGKKTSTKTKFQEWGMRSRGSKRNRMRRPGASEDGEFSDLDHHNRRRERHGSNRGYAYTSGGERDAAEDQDEPETPPLPPPPPSRVMGSPFDPNAVLHWNENPGSADDCSSSEFFRTVSRATCSGPFETGAGTPSHPVVRFTFEAESFLWNQVRHMVGTALAVQRADLPTEVVRATLMCPARLQMPIVPANTLVLASSNFNSFMANDQVRHVGLDSGTLHLLERFEREQLNHELRRQLVSPTWNSIEAFGDFAKPEVPPETVAELLDVYNDWVSRGRPERR